MLLILPQLGTELIPQMSQGEFNVDLRLPPGTPLEQTDRSVQAAQRASAALGNVALAYSVAGTGNRLDANPVDAGENTGRLSITLVKGSDREDEEAAMAGMRRELENLPGVQYRFSRPALFSMATPLEVAVTVAEGDSLSGLLTSQCGQVVGAAPLRADGQDEHVRFERGVLSLDVAELLPTSDAIECELELILWIERLVDAPEPGSLELNLASASSVAFRSTP